MQNAHTLRERARVICQALACLCCHLQGADFMGCDLDEHQLQAAARNVKSAQLSHRMQLIQADALSMSLCVHVSMWLSVRVCVCVCVCVFEENHRDLRGG